MKYWIVLLGLCLMGCKHLRMGENFRGDIISEIDTCLVGGKHRRVEENSLKEFKDLNRPRIYIKYKQPVNGYTVKVLWLPFTDENGYTYETGNAILYFESKRDNFYIQTNAYRDTAIYSHTHLKDGDVLLWDYTRKKDDEILSKYSPFFFSDVNFDGKEELLINDYNGGSRGSNAYEVYEVSPYLAEILKDPPFNVLEDGITEFDPKNKTITKRHSLSAFEMVTHIYKAIKQERVEFGDPEVFYKFELIEVDIWNQYKEQEEHKMYRKDGFKYELVKDEKIPIRRSLDCVCR